MEGWKRPSHDSLGQIHQTHYWPTKKTSQYPNTVMNGHTPLAKHLHCISKIDSPICPACQQGEESVQYSLLHCSAHQRARHTLCNNTGERDINIMKLLMTPKTLCTLFKYIAKTRQFHSTFGDIPILDGEQQTGRVTGDRRQEIRGWRKKRKKNKWQQMMNTTPIQYTWSQNHLLWHHWCFKTHHVVPPSRWQRKWTQEGASGVQELPYLFTLLHIGIIMGVGKPMVFRSWVIQVWVWYLKYSTCVIPYPYPWCHRFSWGGTLECSILVEDELLLLHTSNPSVIYEYLLSPIPIPNGSAIHAQWPVPSAAIPQKLKCYILAIDQLFLLKTWNPHFLFTSYLYCLQCWNLFPSPRLKVMWSITWLVSVSPGRSAYPKVVRAHSNYVYKTCSMHQYDLVPLPPNFHNSSYFKPTNRKSKHQYYLPLCTVGASSTGYGPWCQRRWRLSSALMAAAKD